MAETNKPVIMRNKDGEQVYPITHANAVIMNGNLLGEVVKSNEEAIDGIKEDTSEALRKAEENEEKLEDVLYIGDLDDSSGKFVDLVLPILGKEIDLDSIYNIDYLIEEIHKYIGRMNDVAVGHIKMNEPDTQTKINSTFQEIENLRAEIEFLKQRVLRFEDIIDNFLRTDYANEIIKSIRDLELVDIYDKIQSLENRLVSLQLSTKNEVDRINSLLGTKDFKDLPGYEEGKDISMLKVLWALYSSVHNFID